MRTRTHSLFGGALFGAGLACTHACAAPELVFGPYAQGRVLTDPDGTGLIELERHTPGPGPFAPDTFDDAGTLATFGAGVGEMWFTHDRDGAALHYSAAQINATFTVTEATAATIEWDPGSWYSQVLFVNDTAGVILFLHDDEGAGSEVVPLEPGITYWLVLGTYGWDPGGESWGRLRLGASGAGCNPADINQDGVLNFDDLDAFIDAFLLGCS